MLQQNCMTFKYAHATVICHRSTQIDNAKLFRFTWDAAMQFLYYEM